VSPRISFRQRKVNRIFCRIFRRRRKEHLESRVFQAKRRFKNLFTIRQKIILVVGVFTIGSLIGFTNFSGFFDVAKVSVARSSLDLPLSEIELSIRDLALGKNIFGVDKSLLQRAVLEMRGDISRVKISKKLPREIQVEVFKFPIVAELGVGDEKIYLNEKGFEVKGDFPDRDTLQLVLGDEVSLIKSEEDSQNSKQIISEDHLNFIREAVFYFESLTNLKILNTKYFPISREAHLKTEKNFNIWLDLNYDFREQLNKLVVAADELKIDTKKYEYIDLRIQGKIFFKPKNS